MRPISVAAIILFLILTVTGASAQTCPDPQTATLPAVAVDEKGGTFKRIFNIYKTYCVKEMTIGAAVTVTITIETEKKPGSPMLEIKELPSVSREDLDLITFLPTSPE